MEAMLKECEEMQVFLEMEYSEDVGEMMSRLSKLSVYMARSGKLLADAGKMRDKAITKLDNLKQLIPLGASVQKIIIESSCEDENHLVKWLDRINRTCTHQAENLRTQISFAKGQLELERRGY